MYNKLIEGLKSKGVKFDKGLSDSEITEIQKVYNISFPAELKEFYTNSLPISAGFYNWRDFSEQNVKLIKNIMQSFKDIIKYSGEVDWCENWGAEPENTKDRAEAIKNMVNNAPKMIPIYSHRAMASFDTYENPVFSISGVDIICYGINLTDYLENEFKLKKPEPCSLNRLSYIPFWSDMLL